MNTNLVKLSEKELVNHHVGEAITLTTVMAVIAVALVAVIVYRLFLSKDGKVSIPGGWKFEWQ